MDFKEIKSNSQRYRWFILGIISVGTFMGNLDSSIVNVALPTISQSLNADLSILQWVATAYLLTITSLLPNCGRIADMLGRKRVYSMGFVFFILGSFLCGIAHNVWFLIAMRILQGIGASMLMANSPAIVTAVFPPQERGRALGIIGTVVALGNLAGPGIGGILVGLVGWRAIFYINLPIGIIGYIAARLILPDDITPKEQQNFDFIGAALFTLGMSSLLLAVNNGQDWGWQSTPILIGLALGILLLGLFFYIETRVNDPIIDLSLFRNWPFLAGNLSGVIFFIATFSYPILMPFYLQNMLFYNPSQVGLLMMAFPLMMAVVSPISGYVSDRIGPVFLCTAGLLLTAVGLYCLSTLTLTSNIRQILLGPIMLGIGAGLFNSPNNSSVMSSVHQSKLGVAGGITALVRNVGMVIGIAFSVALFENRQDSIFSTLGNQSPTLKVQAFLTAYHTVMYVAIGIAILGALISLNRKGYVLANKNNSLHSPPH